MGEGELELCLPSPMFGRGAGGEGKNLSKIGMLPMKRVSKALHERGIRDWGLGTGIFTQHS